LRGHLLSLGTKHRRECYPTHGFFNPKTIICDFMKKSKKKKRSAKKIFLLSALRIPYILLHNYNAETRHRFNRDYPLRALLYKTLLKLAAEKTGLPVKQCLMCKIKYLPDYRTQERQEHCPYGCVELNRRLNRKKSKIKYRKTNGAKLLHSDYNRASRERKKNGCIAAVLTASESEKDVSARRLTAQIRFIYKSFNPGAGSEKLEQLDRILSKVSAGESMI
jgi:hypothetical protein